MNRINFLISGAVVMLLISCSPQISEPQTPTFQLESISTPIEKIIKATDSTSSTSRPTNAAIQVSVTETTTPSSTPFPFQLQAVCPSIGGINNLPTGLIGTIVLSGENYQFQEQTFIPQTGQKTVLLFWNVLTGQKNRYELPEKELYYYYSTSLDQKWLALTTGKTDEITTTITILDQVGIEYSSFPLPGDWTMYRWLNNDKLLVRFYRAYKDQLKGLRLLNPFSGEQQELIPDFPEIHFNSADASWGIPTVYDPMMTRVLYPRQDDTLLWNLREKNIIAIAPVVSYPTWSNDGSNLALIVRVHPVRDEIYLLSSKGELTRITYLDSFYKTYDLHYPAWSPDGRYLALWLQKEFDPSVRYNLANLAVLDTRSGELTEYCFESAPYAWRFGDSTLGYADYQVNSAPLIWSPDGRYILTEGIDLNNDPFTKRQTYLVGIQEQTIIKIADDARPVSWMASP